MQPLWRAYAGKILAGLLVAGMLVYRLGSLVPRLMPTEINTLAGSSNLPATILANPLNLPLKLLQWIAGFLPEAHAVFFDRLPSVLLALVVFLIFVYITKRWYGLRSMLFGALLFATSAWFLHVGRFAGTDIEYLAGILALLAVHVGLHDHEDRPLMFYLWLLVNLVLLFIPGLVWFVVFSALLQWRTLGTAWRHLGTIWNRLAWHIALLAGLGSLAYTLVRHNNLLRTWAGLPEHFVTWQNTLRYIGASYTALAYHAPYNPELWVGRLPLLDIFVVAMALAGIAFYVRHWKAQRTHLLFGYLLLGGILAGLGGAVHLSVLMPLAYLIATAGTAYALHFWLRVFPRNPVARDFAIALMGCLVLLAAFYNVKLYYEVWPHDPDTAAIEAHQ